MKKVVFAIVTLALATSAMATRPKPRCPNVCPPEEIVEPADTVETNWLDSLMSLPTEEAPSTETAAPAQN